MSWFGSASRWVGTSNRFLQISVATLAVSAPVLAADWSLQFGASESLIFDDNLDLDQNNPDAGMISTTAVNLDLLAKAKTYKMEFRPAVNVQKSFFREEPDDWKYFPSATLALGKSSKLTTYDLVATYARSEASTNELVEDIISVNKGDRLNYAVTGTITHKVNERNSLIWSNAASQVDYTIASEDLVPSLTLTSTGTWRHEVSALVSTNLTGSAQYYDPDSATLDQRLLYRATVGGSARLSKRLSVSGAVGAVFLDPEHDAMTADVIFNVGADYKLKDTGFTFSAARDLVPSQDGSLDDRYTTRLAMNHQVNDLLTLGLYGTYSFQSNEDEGDSSAFTISPSLNYQLSQDWSSAISYRYIETDDDTGTAHSNAVTLSLSYGTFLLP